MRPGSHCPRTYFGVGRAGAGNHSYFLMLKAAFEQRLGQVGGEAVMLDSVVEIATETGYKGTADRAARIMQQEGGFIVESLTARRPDARFQPG